jgi:hypothetical protein
MDHQALGDRVMTSGDTLGISAPWMKVEQLDPIQWGRLYSLLMKPNRAATGLYILHDKGRVTSVTPAYAQSLLGLPPNLDDPEVAAAELHTLWTRGPVAIFEAAALKRTFDRIQRARDNGDDIVSFLIKLAGEIGREPGIVIEPNPFAAWRNVPPGLPRAFVNAVAPGGQKASVVLAVYDDDAVWTSLLLGFEGGQLTLVTTLPPASGIQWRDDHCRLVPYAEKRFGPVALGVFCPLALVERIGLGPRSVQKWLAAEVRGEFLCAPLSIRELAEKLASMLA